MRVAGYQRLVVRKRYRSKIFQQIVTYLKKQPPELFCRKKLKIKKKKKKLKKKACVVVFFNKVTDPRACNASVFHCNLRNF